MANETVFKRYKGNPIVTPNDLPGANSIFNSAVLPFGKGYVGVFRVDGQARSSELHVGWSKDGIRWKIEPDLIDIRGAVPERTVPGLGYDPRVTEIEGVYYVTWCYYPDYPPGAAPCIGLGKTKDFKKFEQISTIVFPYDRNAVLFPRKIGGKYAILHRPSDPGHTRYGDVYYCTSPDLIHWGDHKFCFGPTDWWQSSKVGAGPSPIETKEGWLLIYHGVRITCNGYVYSAGGAILDLDEPWKVLYRTKRYLLAPTTPYECMGDVPNVVFPVATILDRKTKRLALYYGAADTVVALAHAQLDDVIEFVKEFSYQRIK